MIGNLLSYASEFDFLHTGRFFFVWYLVSCLKFTCSLFLFNFVKARNMRFLCFSNARQLLDFMSKNTTPESQGIWLYAAMFVLMLSLIEDEKVLLSMDNVAYDIMLLPLKMHILELSVCVSLKIFALTISLSILSLILFLFCYH